MPVRTRTFTCSDHDALDGYLLKMRVAVRKGMLHRADAASDLGHLFDAVDSGNSTQPLARADHPDEFTAHLANRRARANAR